MSESPQDSHKKSNIFRSIGRHLTHRHSEGDGTSLSGRSDTPSSKMSKETPRISSKVDDSSNSIFQEASPQRTPVRRSSISSTLAGNRLEGNAVRNSSLNVFEHSSNMPGGFPAESMSPVSYGGGRESLEGSEMDPTGDKLGHNEKHKSHFENPRHKKHSPSIEDIADAEYTTPKGNTHKGTATHGAPHTIHMGTPLGKSHEKSRGTPNGTSNKASNGTSNGNSSLGVPKANLRPKEVSRSQSTLAVGDSDDDDEEDEFQDTFGPEGLPTVSSVAVEKHTHSHSAMLIEAVNDTPSFHASAEFLDIQIKQLLAWLMELQEKTSKVDSDLAKVKGSVNDVISLFMPSVTHKSLLAQDYTTLLFGRYTEAESLYWTDLFASVRRNTKNIEDMVQRLVNGIFKQYADARQEYINAYQELQSARHALLRLPKVALPVAVRDANLLAWRCYRLMVRASSKLVLILGELESEASLSLLETLSEQYVGHDNGFFNYDRTKLAISTELLRLNSFATSLRASMPQLNAEMRRLRNEALQSVRKMRPPTSVKSYEKNNTLAAMVGETPFGTEAQALLKDSDVTSGTSNRSPAGGSIESDTSELPHLGQSARGGLKVGWVNVRVAKDDWQLYWGFMQNGLFGFLGLTPSRTAVTESNRIVIHRSTFEIVNHREKNNVFRITSGNISVIVQAFHKLDLALWEKAFNTNKALAIDKHWSTHELHAWDAEYFIPVLGGEVAPVNQIINSQLQNVVSSFMSLHWLQYNSTLTAEGAAGFSSNVPALKPMPTSNIRNSVLANGFLRPHGIPNSITANFWGSVGHFKESELLNFTVPNYGEQLPNYPASYPRGLVVQDLGMRAFAAQLTPDNRPEIDDILVLFLRTTTYMFGCEVPARLYATGKKLLFYACWNGLIALNSVPLEKVLEVESRHGVASSELRITLHELEGLSQGSEGMDSSGNERGSQIANDAVSSETDYKNQRVVVHFNLYIDSTALAQRKLNFLLQNSRSREPLSSAQLIEPLGIINLEYAEAMRSKELQLENDLTVRPRAKSQDLTQSKPSADDSTPNTFAEWLLGESVGERNTLGEEDAHQFGKGMQSKLAQDTFPISTDALFTLVFGPASPVFLYLDTEELPKISTKIEPWVRNDRRQLERRIAQTFKASAHDHKETRYNVQKVEHVEHELYVVTERRCAWEMPSGEQFHLVLKYVVYATPTGSHLQIWGRVFWRTKNVSSTIKKTVQSFVKIEAQKLALRVRDASEGVHTNLQAEDKYGEVKAVKTVHSSSSAKAAKGRSENDAIRVSTRHFTKFVLHSQLATSCTNIFSIVRYICRSILKASSPVLFSTMIFTVVLLVVNYHLYSKANSGYWEAYFEQQKTDQIIDSLQVLPPSASLFKKAVYTQDLNDLLAKGAEWKLPSTNFTIHKNGCANKFKDLAELSVLTTELSTDLYALEPKIKETVDRIATLRFDYAQRRSEMMSLIHMLNLSELNEIQDEFKRWMISESAMCSRARPVLYQANESVYERVSLYCLSCLDETKYLL